MKINLLILNMNNHRTYDSCTLFVLNEDKSNDIKEEQEENIQLISLTLFVINKDKLIEFKL